MGVVPAWLANPRTVTSHMLIPTIPSTTPMLIFSASKIPPCSMCNSRYARISDEFRLAACRLSGSPPMKRIPISFDHTDVDLFRFQNSTLFNVQFQVCENIRRISFGRLQVVRIAADEANSFSDGLSAVTLYLKRCLTKFADSCVTSCQSAFFIGKYDDLQRVSCYEVLLIQDFDAFQRAENSQSAVVVPAMRNGVSVRTEQNHRQLRITPFSAANNVSRSIDTDF